MTVARRSDRPDRNGAVRSPGATILAALVLAALPLRAEVFHEPLCESLPEVTPEVKAWVARAAPQLAGVRVRELADKAALDLFGRAAAVGWGSIDVLTHDVFREPCTFYLSQQALRDVDAAFDLNFLTPIRGRDIKGQDFEMNAMLAGRGKLVAFYERDGIVYRNEKQDRNFQLASRVEFDTPVAGVLEKIHGLCAKALLLGCVRVRSMVKSGETVEVRVGTFTSESPLTAIKARGASDEAKGRVKAARVLTSDKK
jgi:hypothetical protein